MEELITINEEILRTVYSEADLVSVECAIDRSMTVTTTSLESLSIYVQQFAWHVYVEFYVKVYVQLYIILCT